MTDTDRTASSRKDIQAAIRTVLDGAGNALHAATYDELERLADKLDQAVAQDEADHKLGGAIRDALLAGYGFITAGIAPVALGRAARDAVESTGRRIATGDEQPVGDVAGYVIVTSGGVWDTRSDVLTDRSVAERLCRSNERVAALYLLPKAVAGE